MKNDEPRQFAFQTAAQKLLVELHRTDIIQMEHECC